MRLEREQCLQAVRLAQGDEFLRRVGDEADRHGAEIEQIGRPPGAVGLPVFATGAGLAYMAGPTGGYLVGFVVAATIAGWAADRGLDRHPVKLFAAMLVGELAILGLGAAWLAYLFGADKAIAFGVGPFIVTDLVKVALAAAIVPAAWNLVARFRG